VSLRVAVAVALACVVTFGLFWAMQALIGVSGELKEGRPPPSIDFVRLRRDTAPETKKREPPKREKPEQPPPPPDISTSKANLDLSNTVGVVVPDLNPADALAGGIGAGGGSDREAVPLVRIEPEYPMRARQRGIEGWVVVRFDISAAGGIKNPSVVDAHPGTIFNNAALIAIRKWKYNPKIENGVAVERTGQQILLEFTMEN
jgi:protein TonB